MNFTAIIGRLVKDAEIRMTPESQMTVATFTLAVPTGKKDEVDFIGCKAFGKTAELIEKFTSKGKQIAAEGRIKNETWEKDGKKNSKTYIYVDRITLLSGEKKEESKEEEIKPTMPTGFSQVEDEDIPF